MALRVPDRSLPGLLFAWAACALLAGCAATETPADPPSEAPARPAEATTPRAIGGDRDAHGCLPAAGYTWCERTGRCERSWELAAKVGIEKTFEAYQAYCAAKP